MTTSDPEGRLWCSTRVDSDRVHVGGGGHWGHCPEEGCPVSDDPHANDDPTEGLEEEEVLMGKGGWVGLCFPYPDVSKSNPQTFHILAPIETILRFPRLPSLNSRKFFFGIFHIFTLTLPSQKPTGSHPPPGRRKDDPPFLLFGCLPMCGGTDSRAFSYTCFKLIPVFFSSGCHQSTGGRPRILQRVHHQRRKDGYHIPKNNKKNKKQMHFPRVPIFFPGQCKPPSLCIGLTDQEEDANECELREGGAGETFKFLLHLIFTNTI